MRKPEWLCCSSLKDFPGSLRKAPLNIECSDNSISGTKWREDLALHVQEHTVGFNMSRVASRNSRMKKNCDKNVQPSLIFLGREMEPAMFSVANMFGSDSGDEEDEAFVERDHAFPGLVLRIREFAFHQVNANLLWPGASIFAEWIVEHEELIRGHRVLELGSGTGALAIFLKKRFELDITTSDYDDVEIENNIRSNCHLNGLSSLPHIRHTWGEDFPYTNPDWDLIIASDILLYVKQYPNLIQTLCFLLKQYNFESDHVGREKALASEPSRPNTQAALRVPSISGLGTQSQDRLGAASSSGAVAGSSPNRSNLKKEWQTQRSDTGSINGLRLPSSFSDEPCVEDCQTATDLQAPTSSKEWALSCRSCLPRPCFLMSWRRRIPKQDESLFFEGCARAGLAVIDFGSRVYCIHCPV